MIERWKAIKDYEGLYEVSSFGRVRRLAGSPKCCRTRILTLGFNERTGYFQVCLWRCNCGKTKRVSVLVARAFIGPCPAGKEVNHKDTIRTNNRDTNLEYLTREENIHHAMEFGRLDKRGEKHHNARLTGRQVRAIRKCLSMGESGKALALRFGVQRSQISRIKTGKRWAHL